MRDFDINSIALMASTYIPIPTNDTFLDARYEWQKTANGVEWPYYRFFYHITSLLRPKLTVELGGYQGTAAAHFAKGWDEGTVITIDHHTDQGDQENQIKMMNCVREIENFLYFQGWTTPRLAKENVGEHALGNVDSVYEDVEIYIQKSTDKIGILFIDSWHNYKYAKMDWEAYLPLMSSPGLIICDDIQDGEGEHDPISGMLRFWEELPEPKFLNSNLHPGTNLGFVKV